MVRFLFATASAIALGGFAAPALATSVTFESFESTNPVGLTPTVTVSETVRDTIVVDIELGTGDVGSLIGVFFDFGSFSLPGLPSINAALGNVGAGSTFSFPSGDVGSACGSNADIGTNIGSLTAPDFDWAVCYDKKDTRGKDSVTVAFDIIGVDPDDFNAIGLRYQESNNGNDTSDKLLTFTKQTPPEDPEDPDGVVPLPAAGWLLIGGIGGLAALRRRKTA